MTATPLLSPWLAQSAQHAKKLLLGMHLPAFTAGVILVRAPPSGTRHCTASASPMLDALVRARQISICNLPDAERGQLTAPRTMTESAHGPGAEHAVRAACRCRRRSDDPAPDLHQSHDLHSQITARAFIGRAEC